MTREEMLEKLTSDISPEEKREIGTALLEADPNSPYGKFAIWESMDYEDEVENLDMLREAHAGLRAIVEAKEIPAFADDDVDCIIYCLIMINLGYALLTLNESAEAYEVAKEFTNFDDEGAFPSRTVLYRSMLDLELYDAILETLESDPVETVVGEHARAIAMLETGKDEGEVRDAIIYAISLSVDVPFFVTGIWELDGEDLEDDDYDIACVIDDALYLSDPWQKTETRLAAISAPTFLLGYLTDRIEDKKEIKVLRESYKETGLYDRIEGIKKQLADLEKGGKDPEEIDAVALGETASILEDVFGGGEGEKG